MLAVDTNVVVRFVAGDDPAQYARAAALFRRQVVWIAKTVLLEAEWVLRSIYEYEPEQIAVALRRLAGLPNVEVEDPGAVAQALDWYQQDLDFADALHLASKAKSGSFLSFDQKLVKRAQRTGCNWVSLL
jgi:predicted nucleic-acid-binding protein